MKKIILLFLAAFTLAGCASYSLVSTERRPQISELNGADRLGLLVLVDYEGFSGILIGNEDRNGEVVSWVTGSYDPLMNGTVELWARHREIAESYLSPGAASLFIGNSLVELFGNGPKYNYSSSVGMSLRPRMVSNYVTDNGTTGEFIEGPEVFAVESDLSYYAEDRDLIPLALRYGKEAGIDALVVIRLEVFTEAGILKSLPEDEFGGSLEWQIGTALSAGDYFVRTEVYPDNMMVIDAETGVVLADFYEEITGIWVGGSKTIHKVEGVSRPEGLKRFLRSAEYGKLMAESAKIESSVLVQYIRPHYWTEAVRN